MKAQTLFFVAPRQIEIRETNLPQLKDDEVLVESICSAISAGTEMLVYQGRFPGNIETDSSISGLRGGFKYPLAYGYACVGVVIEAGKQIDKSWRDRLVFAFQPHTSHFAATLDSLFPIPHFCQPDKACFLPSMETAVNLVQDGAPILGERVLVLGQGVVGLLTASLLNEFPLEILVTADPYALRRKASLDIGVEESFDTDRVGHTNDSANTTTNSTNNTMNNSINNPTNSQTTTITGSINQLAYTQNNFDLTFELSGSPAALNDAIALTCFSGRIVIGSWYGEKQAEIDLGSAFHRSRIKLISSQVSTIAPDLSGRWNKSRRFDVAWKALERVRPEKWITHRFPIEAAKKAYELLDENPQKTIQVIFEYQR